MKNQAADSLWKQTVSSEFSGLTMSDDVRCDVAVIGAGFTGLRAALKLAEAGTSVSVFDSGDVGFGASGRNGGQVNPMLPVQRPDDLLKAVGPTYFERLAAISLDSADALFRLVDKYKIDCGARQNGWLRVDHCPKARKTARTAAEAWREHGMQFEFLDGPDVARMTGSPLYQSAVLAPKGGAIQPLSLVRGLARAATDAGAKIYEKAGIDSVEQVDGKWLLQSGTHRIRADWVIVATNGYTSDVTPGIKETILPITPIQFATDPLPDDVIGDILPEGQTISDTRRVIMYARREPGNQFVYGGHGTDLGTKFGGFEWLKRDVERVYPQLRGVTWRYRWGGNIAVTEKRVPNFLEPAPGMVAGLGYSGRGVAMSLVVGKVLAERVLGAAPETLPLPVSPTKPMPLRLTQKFGAGIAIKCMKMLDGLEGRLGR